MKRKKVPLVNPNFFENQESFQTTLNFLKNVAEQVDNCWAVVVQRLAYLREVKGSIQVVSALVKRVKLS